MRNERSARANRAATAQRSKTRVLDEARFGCVALRRQTRRGTDLTGRFRIAPHRTASRASPCLSVCLSVCSSCLLAPGAETRTRLFPSRQGHPKQTPTVSPLAASESSSPGPRGTRGHASSWPMPAAHATPPRAIWSKATNEAVANARHRLAVPARPSDAVCGSCNLVGSASHPHPWLLRADWPVASAAQPITVAALLAHHRRCSAATDWAVVSSPLSRRVHLLWHWLLAAGAGADAEKRNKGRLTWKTRLDKTHKTDTHTHSHSHTHPLTHSHAGEQGRTERG